MWILPKSLTSRYVPGMAESTSDSDAAFHCAQSLMRRSKPSQSSAYLREWKAGNLMRLRSGAILSPSLGKAFEIEWTYLLEAIPASPSPLPANDSEPTIHVTSGQALQQELPLCAPESASLKMSRDTSASDSERSLQAWKALVMQRRGEYSQRLNAERLTSGSECSSWPTAKARDWKDTAGCSLDAVNPDGSHRNRRDRLMGAVMAEISGLLAPESFNTDGSHPELSGKLNPRWVEALMGLPIGWTMPSCGQPIANHVHVVTMSSAGNVEDTTQTAHVRAHIATMIDSRIDELRLLGNGVVPATAALAFTTLLNEQRNTRHLA